MYTVTCRLCGQQFQSSFERSNVCEACKNRPCEICGKSFVHEWPYDQRVCSAECRHLLRTDPANVALKEAKRKVTVLEKYGVENVSCLESSKEKIREARAKKAAESATIREREQKLKQQEKEKRKAEKEEAARQAKLRACKKCGKLFMPTSGRNYYCREDHFDTCKICGQSYLIKYEDLPYERNVCYNSECANKWRKQRNLEIYGVENSGNLPQFIEKRKETNLKRYGVDNPFKSEHIKERIKSSILANWGEGMPELVKRRQETCLKKYGVSNPRRLPEVEARRQQTCLERYGSRFPNTALLTSPEIQHKAALTKISKINRAFKEELDKVGWDAQFEFQLESKSFDLYMEGHPILVEVDPTYTHYSLGTVYQDYMPSVETNRQLQKSILAKKHGFHCVHIFDWDDSYKTIQLLRRDRSRIYARQCKVVEIDTATASDFEAVYHLQGSVRNQLVCIGLDYNGKLVEVMTFGQPRYNKKYQWELLRLCSHFDYTIVGGASKLFNYFIKNYYPESIISYCDRAKFSGAVYKNIGMRLHHTTDPAKIWSKGVKKITDNLLRQRGYDQLFGTNFGKGTSNEQLMLDNGWCAVYDCGQFVFEWLLDNDVYKGGMYDNTRAET